ncbi:hypothetical protein BMS3Abin12_02137 [bacterium BMS3Abin12]|nr:hypothetical protein BMS3Abin12_02137 [bacterium BMS3Abin12]GBE50287.1 hypothetical protein BMS3Bbin13_01219 [bacterium BMS3Bbin13]
MAGIRGNYTAPRIPLRVRGALAEGAAFRLELNSRS